MSISVNGQSQVPPGFRFHPTEEELLQYYLRKKVASEKIDLDVIRDVDLNKLEPWDIQEHCKIGSTPQNDWYFFSHKDKKYPTGTRTNRATVAGFWKATGRDKVIYSNSRRIGMRKTLVFYKGRAPHGQKSDWIMHEYRLDDNTGAEVKNVCHAMGETAAQEEGWVVCRIFKKKNHHKTLDSPIISTSPIITAEISAQQKFGSNDGGTLEQILEYMGRTCMEESEANHRAIAILPTPVDAATSSILCERFMRLPSLESPKSSSSHTCYQRPFNVQLPGGSDNDAGIVLSQVMNANGDLDSVNYQSQSGISDWASLDRLVATHLNGQNETAKQLSSCFSEHPTTNTSMVVSLCSPPDQDLRLRSSTTLSSSNVNNRAYHDTQDYENECELWSFTRSHLTSSDPLSHMPNVSV